MSEKCGLCEILIRNEDQRMVLVKEDKTTIIIIIEAGVAALQHAGEFTEETQAALDWLRKVNTPPRSPEAQTGGAA